MIQKYDLQILKEKTPLCLLLSTLHSPLSTYSTLLTYPLHSVNLIFFGEASFQISSLRSFASILYFLRFLSDKKCKIFTLFPRGNSESETFSDISFSYLLISVITSHILIGNK